MWLLLLSDLSCAWREDNRVCEIVFNTHCVVKCSYLISEDQSSINRNKDPRRCLPEAVLPTCGLVDQRAQQLHLGLQLSQPEANRLVVEDGLLEDLPLPCVLDGLLNDVVHYGQSWRRPDKDGDVSSGRLLSGQLRTLTVGRCPEPLFLELKHLVGEAQAFLADDVLTGNADVIEEHFSRVWWPHPQFIDPASNVYAFVREKKKQENEMSFWHESTSCSCGYGSVTSSYLAGSWVSKRGICSCAGERRWCWPGDTSSQPGYRWWSTSFPRWSHIHPRPSLPWWWYLGGRAGAQMSSVLSNSMDRIFQTETHLRRPTRLQLHWLQGRPPPPPLWRGAGTAASAPQNQTCKILFKLRG